MITLNLLPAQKKKEIRTAEIYLLIKDLIILILVFALISAIILLVAKIILQNYFNQIVAETTLTNRFAKLFSTDIKDFNQKLNKVDEIQSDYITWTIFFTELNRLIPTNINLFDLTISNDQLLITGQAKTRNDLIQLKDNLDDNDLFSQTTIPLDNLLKKENIAFSLKAKVIIDKLKSSDAD